MAKKYPPVYYGDYLDLDKLLDSQHRKSEEYGHPAHDEMLFIIVHQAYELWFKQIIFELNSVVDMFDDNKVDERNIGIAISRLDRITEIQRILIDQLRVLETMTPLDFLDFRDYLVPASGFQSVQFRTIENKLGLRTDMRVTFGSKEYHELVSESHQKELINSEKNMSLLEVVNGWLERTPFLKVDGFNFIEQYKGAVNEMLDWEKDVIATNPEFTDEKREKQFVSMKEQERASHHYSTKRNTTSSSWKERRNFHIRRHWRHSSLISTETSRYFTCRTGFLICW